MRGEEIPARPLPHRRMTPEQVEIASVDDMASWLVAIEDDVSVLEQNRAVVLAEFDSRDGHHVYGHPSTVAFLKTVCRMAGGRARRLVKHARAARNHVATFAAWRFGHISSDQAQQLFDISEELPDRYSEAESVLLDIAGDTPDETRKTLDYWKNRVDSTGVELDVDTQLVRRRFDIVTKPNGMVAGNFLMTGTAGLAFRSAVDALMPPPEGDDNRTAPQRRHDAIEDLARDFLEIANTRASGGEKPHINVHCDLDALAAEPGGLHETTSGQVLTVSAIRQLACDASLTRIVFGPESEILDVGRKTRVISPALRRAVIARDRHCQHPGCGRSAAWCDVHHLIHWADGGETILTNLVLLCRYHHTLTHQNDAKNRLDRNHQEVPADAGLRPI